MHLPKRLQSVAAHVHSGGVVADIGCDHAFTSIYLVEEGKAACAIAMDANGGPLARAKGHIRQHGLEARISLRLSDGVSGLAKGEADTLLISGMGGALIKKILLDGKETAQTAKELVLSPQSEVFLVRRCVHSLGFRIAEEEMVYDQGKYYVILYAVPGVEVYAQEAEYLYGKKLIEGREETFCHFIQSEIGRVGAVLQKLGHQDLSAPAQKRQGELQAEKEQLEAILHKMELGGK